MTARPPLRGAGMGTPLFTLNTQAPLSRKTAALEMKRWLDDCPPSPSLRGDGIGYTECINVVDDGQSQAVF